MYTHTHVIYDWYYTTVSSLTPSLPCGCSPQVVSLLGTAPVANDDMHVCVNLPPTAGASKGSSSVAVAEAEGSSCVAGLRSPKWRRVIVGILLIFIAAAVIIPCAILLRPQVSEEIGPHPFGYRTLALLPPSALTCTLGGSAHLLHLFWPSLLTQPPMPSSRLQI